MKCAWCGEDLHQDSEEEVREDGKTICVTTIRCECGFRQVFYSTKE